MESAKRVALKAKDGRVGSLRARLCCQRGTAALPELLVSAALMVFVLGVVFFIYMMAVNQQDRVEARAQTQISQTLAFQRIVRELRQATRVNQSYGGTGARSCDSVNPILNCIDFDALIKNGDAPPQPLHIRYECSSPAWGPPDNSSYVAVNNDGFPSGALRGHCSRREGPVGEALGAPVVVIRNMRNFFGTTGQPNFTLDPSDSTCPTAITIRISVDIRHRLEARVPNPRTPLVLEDSVNPRNPCTP
jgi:type II secretory pathway pseudopilin PulG